MSWTTVVETPARSANGHPVSLESYARVAVALGLRPTLELGVTTGRNTTRTRGRIEAEDFVHAAMGEVEAAALAGAGRTVAIDEPYHHYQFAGRADLLAWDREDLLHIENRTRFPNLQEAAGSYNAKRLYLARALADRLGIGPRGWRSVTHVMACLWSAETLHILRIRRATFAALCPDGGEDRGLASRRGARGGRGQHPDRPRSGRPVRIAASDDRGAGSSAAPRAPLPRLRRRGGGAAARLVIAAHR